MFFIVQSSHFNETREKTDFRETVTRDGFRFMTSSSSKSRKWILNHQQVLVFSPLFPEMTGLAQLSRWDPPFPLMS